MSEIKICAVTEVCCFSSSLQPKINGPNFDEIFICCHIFIISPVGFLIFSKFSLNIITNVVYKKLNKTYPSLSHQKHWLGTCLQK